MSTVERAHWESLARVMSARTAECDRYLLAEYARAVERGENPPPPILCAERKAIDEREAAARRAKLPPYTGPVRTFSPVHEMYGFPDDVRDDELAAFDAEHRRPWSWPRQERSVR